MKTETPLTERLASLRRFHEKWTLDLQAAVGVNPDLANAIAQALDDLSDAMWELENEAQ